jgi:hypothetical protein
MTVYERGLMAGSLTGVMKIFPKKYLFKPGYLRQNWVLIAWLSRMGLWAGCLVAKQGISGRLPVRFRRCLPSGRLLQ